MPLTDDALRRIREHANKAIVEGSIVLPEGVVLYVNGVPCVPFVGDMEFKSEGWDESMEQHKVWFMVRTEEL